MEQQATVKREFVIDRQGKQFVTYQGLLDLGHAQGLKEIRTDVIQFGTAENDHTWLFRAVVTTDRGTFTGFGDASPANVSRAMLNCLPRFAECVPWRTEILTRNGWRTFNQLSIGEKVLAYDVESDSCRWVKLENVTVYGDFLPTKILQSRSFRAICTPEHTWAVSNSGHRRLAKTNELHPNDSIIVAAPAESGDHPMTARQASILGWVMTDGTLRYATVHDRWGPYPRMHIDQSKPEQIDVLRKLLGTDATETITQPPPRTFPGGRTYALRPSHRFNLSAELTREILASVGEARLPEDLPALVLHLSHPARAAMLESMLLADGCRRPSCASTWAFGKKRKPGVMEAFELLATLEGRALGRPSWSSGHVVPIRTLRTNRLVTGYHLAISDGEDQSVWCPTTELGTWVMRLDGYITITGNTRAKARALRDAVNVGVTALEELDIDEPEHSAPRPAPRPTPTPQSPTGIAPPPREPTPIQNGPKLSDKQLSAIFSLAHRRGMTDEDVEQYAEANYGCRVSELTVKQASAWISSLNAKEG